ncbi:hypothetical protein Fmac_016538 [Flemingia macrophylla]|uniref:Uncharacterized protein n=1 Tax=Flemingia macrophylla TaxID=520843 RepID=A0ABD1MHM7_9FABA
MSLQPHISSSSKRRKLVDVEGENKQLILLQPVIARYVKLGKMKPFINGSSLAILPSSLLVPCKSIEVKSK